MKPEAYLSVTLAILGPIAAMYPLTHVLGANTSQNLKSITGFPGMMILASSHFIMVMAAILMVASLLEMLQFPIAAPVALAAAFGLSIHYIPRLYDDWTGSCSFGMLFGLPSDLNWAMLACQVTVVACAASLTRRRFQ